MPQDEQEHLERQKTAREQLEHTETLGRPRSNAIFEAPKPPKEKSRFRQSMASHAHFVQFLAGKAEVPEAEIRATAEWEQEAKERGIWIKPFEVPPKHRGFKQAFSSHANFLKVLLSKGEKGEIPEDELKDRAAKKAFLEQWRKDNPGREPEDDMDDGYQRDDRKVKEKLKDAYGSHKAFVKTLWRKGRDPDEPASDGLSDKERLAYGDQKPHTRRKPGKMKLGFSFESAKAKFNERRAAFSKKVSDTFHAAGGGQGFKYFKELAKKLLGSKSDTAKDKTGQPHSFSSEVDLTKAPVQFTAKTKPGKDFSGQDKPKPFAPKSSDSKPFQPKKSGENMFTAMMKSGKTGEPAGVKG